ncbi:restriction endonuclease subunit S [Algoriphagus sanaruensis]|uniref:Type I restriction modification DNA specificity domain-containing protein n=1 Tax=Algoriphagus sanaruensis TaxID=1727163 RepID=A0A142EPM9_9BACT|nr:restriction endonuclease subunit S [Algoriphagus sanaruensis]AMQ57084.1 hypothetical protein AO498_11605 [Algoriphagus sanaruensis]
MKNNWSKITLGDAIELKRGYDLPSNDREVGIIPIVSSSGVTDYHSVAKVKGPGVVTGRYGTIGEVFYLKEDFWPLNTTLYVKDFKGNDPRFFSYFLLCLGIKELNAAGAVPGVNRNHLHKIKISLPSPLTQRKIAAILSAYDDLIENNLKRIKLLEEKAQLTYEEWFVRMKFPGHESTPINEETGLPEGWGFKSLGDFTDVLKGKNITKSTIRDGNVPVVAGGLLPAYYHDTPNTKSPVITVSASGANAGFTCLYHEDIWASDCSYIDSSMTKYLHFIYSSMIHNQAKIYHFQKGAAQPHVYPKDLKRLEIIIPNEASLNTFEGIGSSIFSSVKVFQQQNKLLKEARDILLPRLMTGMIDVEKLDLSAFEQGDQEEMWMAAEESETYSKKQSL